MLLKYGNLILPAGHILDLYRVRISNANPFAKIIQRFISMQNKKFLVAFFQKKVPFLANIERCQKFLEYALTRGIYL